MPLRPSQYTEKGRTDEHTKEQNLIYFCETETRLSLPQICTIQEWANVVDHVWEQSRSTVENGSLDCFGRMRWKLMETGKWERAPIPMQDIPMWIEKYPQEKPIPWSAMWYEPNVVIAGHKPLHVIWAVHEVAHALTYYKQGHEVTRLEPDNGHGLLWKHTYLDLLGQFYPEHAKFLERSFVRNGVDI